MQTFVQRGKTVTLTPSSAVSAGGGCLFSSSLFGVAASDVASGAPGEFVTEGVVSIAKDTGAVSVGAPLYWNASTKKVTASSVGSRVGTAVAAALSADARVSMLMAQPAVSGDGKTLGLTRRPTGLPPAPPTITYSATAPTTGFAVLPWNEAANVVGASVSYNNANGTLRIDMAGAYSGIDIYHEGDELTFGWRCQTATAERVMVFVDGYPCMASPATPSVTTASGSFYYMRLVFGSVARRRIEILMTNINALTGLFLPYTCTAKPGPNRPNVMVVGDSFNAGSTALSSATQLPIAVLAMEFDANFIGNALGGTGYVKTNGSFGAFGAPDRLAQTAAVHAQTPIGAYVFMGSVNDDGQADIGPAAAAAWAAYRAIAPNASVVVFGPQPPNATETLNANRTANNMAVLGAAAGSGDVSAYYDMIGTQAGAPARAWAAFTMFNPAELISHIGAVWRHEATTAAQYPSTGAPGLQNPKWAPMTADLYGTGRVGATTGDGTRDTYLHSDQHHPTPQACQAIAGRIARALSRL